MGWMEWMERWKDGDRGKRNKRKRGREALIKPRVQPYHTHVLGELTGEIAEVQLSLPATYSWRDPQPALSQLAYKEKKSKLTKHITFKN